MRPYNTYQDLKDIAEDTIRHIWENESLITEYITKMTEYYPEGNAGFDLKQLHDPTGKLNTNAEISVEQLTSLQAIEKYPNEFCILNFASAKNPGGGFLKGALAQEETLARSSNLYPALVEQEKFYRNPKAPYYTDRVIYSPDVLFFKNDDGHYIEPIPCSVITCAAPNLNAEGWDLETLKITFLERIEKVFQIAIMNNEENLILGAWGCGVFKNPPEMVAEQFVHMLNKYKRYFTKIVFAIPDEKNFNVFNNIICQ